MSIALLPKLNAELAAVQAQGNALATLAEGAGAYTDEQRTQRDELIAKSSQLKADIAGEEALRAAMLTAPAIVVDGPGVTANTAPTPFSNLGEFSRALKASASAAKQGQAIDPGIASIMAATGASEIVGADGGFLVQLDQRNEILTAIQSESVLASKCQHMTVGEGKNGIRLTVVDETSRVTGSRWGGIQAYHVAEGGTKTATRPKFKPLEMQLQKIAALSVATDELLEDATVYTQYVKSAVPAEIAFVVDDDIYRGTGVGMALGILNSPALVSVSKETGQSADTVIAENLWNMFSRMPARSLPRAEWYVNQFLFPQFQSLALAIGIGGTPLFIPATGISGAPLGTLLGRPVNVIEQASAPGDVGDIVFADFNEYLIIEKGGVKQDSSIHVYFDTDETALRWVYRFNGQPLWSSPVTPYKGTPTVSPFVTLEAR